LTEVKGIQDLYIEGDVLVILTTDNRKHYVKLEPKRNIKK